MDKQLTFDCNNIHIATVDDYEIRVVNGNKLRFRRSSLCSDQEWTMTIPEWIERAFRRQSTVEAGK